MIKCTHGMPNPKSCFDCMYEGNVEPVNDPSIIIISDDDSTCCPICEHDSEGHVVSTN